MATKSYDVSGTPNSAVLRFFSRLTLISVASVFVSACFELSNANQSNYTVYQVSSCQIEGAKSATLDGWTTQPGKVVVTGWALDTIASDVPTTLRIQLTTDKGEIVHLSQIAQRAERPDVAAHFKDSRFAASGFDAVIDANRLASGSYKLSVAQYSRKAATVCISERTLTIR